MRPSTASSESKNRSPCRRNGARLASTSAAIRMSCGNRRLADRFDEGMEHADAELARILAGAAADLSGYERLVDQDVQFSHLGAAKLVRLQMDLAELLVLRNQIERLRHRPVDSDRDVLSVGEIAARLIDVKVEDAVLLRVLEGDRPLLLRPLPL